MTSHKPAIIAVGANLPSEGRNPLSSVREAIAIVLHAAGPEARASRLFRTPAFPPGSGPEFVNAAIRLPWNDTPEVLLEWLHEIEAGFGRTRTARWEARIMDLDLIAVGEIVLPDRKMQARWADLPQVQAAQVTPGFLILPHPRLAERPFVLVPMADIAPDWRHPVTGRTVAEMLAALPDSDLADVRPISAATNAPVPLSSSDTGGM